MRTESVDWGRRGTQIGLIDRLWVFGLYVVFYPTPSLAKLREYPDHNQLVVTQF